MIVVDASVLANALADDEEGGRVAREALRDAGELTAPDPMSAPMTPPMWRWPKLLTANSSPQTGASPARPDRSVASGL